MLRFCDELPFALGWYHDGDPLRRTSHALADDGSVWLIDPVDAPEAETRWRLLGEPRGVIQLLGHHDRDARALAERLGVPHHRVPASPVPGAPFEFQRIPLLPGWREVALWWRGSRTLAVGDALGTVAYFLAPGERIGVHPLVRARPPRTLAGLPAEHVLCGHGAGIHGPGTAAELERAVRTARRRLPAAWLSAVRHWMPARKRGA
jgi:hypothetical protein